MCGDVCGEWYGVTRGVVRAERLRGVVGSLVYAPSSLNHTKKGVGRLAASSPKVTVCDGRLRNDPHAVN